MLSDEEKEAFKEVKHFNELTRYWQEEEYEEKEIAGYIATVLNLIKKQSKEIEEIEELKEKNKTQSDCAEPIERTEEMVNMRWVNHNYILKTESEQKERKAYIKGTNDADELCNKKWKNKIKAKIEEIDEVLKGQLIEKIRVYFEAQKEVLQSLLEKE